MEGPTSSLKTQPLNKEEEKYPKMLALQEKNIQEICKENEKVLKRSSVSGAVAMQCSRRLTTYYFVDH